MGHLFLEGRGSHRLLRRCVVYLVRAGTQPQPGMREHMGLTDWHTLTPYYPVEYPYYPV